MENKYGLGSRKVTTEQHQSQSGQALACKFCQSLQLRLCPSMGDHQCDECGEWQQDVPQGYAMGRSNEY